MVRNFKDQLKILGMGEGLDGVNHFLEDVADIHEVKTQAHAAAFQLGKIKDIVDQRQKVAAVAVDLGDIAQVGGREFDVVGILREGHGFRETDDEVEGGAQFVAGLRNKLFFEMQGGVCIFAGLDQLVVDMFKLRIGDIQGFEGAVQLGAMLACFFGVAAGFAGQDFSGFEGRIEPLRNLRRDESSQVLQQDEHRQQGGTVQLAGQRKRQGHFGGHGQGGGEEGAQRAQQRAAHHNGEKKDIAQIEIFEQASQGGDENQLTGQENRQGPQVMLAKKTAHAPAGERDQPEEQQAAAG